MILSMEKITWYFTLIACLLATHSYAQQWAGGTGSGDKIYRTGRVGIGSHSGQTVSTPSNLFIWQRNQPALIEIMSSGSILDAEGNSRDNSSFLRLKEDNSGFRGGYVEYNNQTNKFHIGTHGVGQSQDLSNDVPAITILRGSKTVGIGTTTPVAGHVLTVDGSVLMEEAKVLVVEGADFVFDEDYDLPSIESIEQHIKARKHLPDIPSAQMMQEEGMRLGEMNILLLQKVEELTLHMIEQHKKIAAQQRAIDTLTKMLEERK